VSQLLLWETEIRTGADGSAEVIARKPLLECDVDRARVYLGGKDVVSRRQIWRLFQHGKIEGYKPRAIAERIDGRASDAKLVPYVESLPCGTVECDWELGGLRPV
jgi:hypothetical protein